MMLFSCLIEHIPVDIRRYYLYTVRSTVHFERTAKEFGAVFSVSVFSVH